MEGGAATDLQEGLVTGGWRGGVEGGAATDLQEGLVTGGWRGE